MCVWVCVGARARERESVCVSVCLCTRYFFFIMMRVYVYVRVRATRLLSNTHRIRVTQLLRLSPDFGQIILHLCFENDKCIMNEQSW